MRDGHIFRRESEFQPHFQGLTSFHSLTLGGGKKRENLATRLSEF